MREKKWSKKEQSVSQKKGKESLFHLAIGKGRTEQTHNCITAPYHVFLLYARFL